MNQELHHDSKITTTEIGKELAEIILELYNAYLKLEDGESVVEANGCEFEDTESILLHIYELPLSIDKRVSSFRAHWMPIDTDDSMMMDMLKDIFEYQILFSTGGPAVRILLFDKTVRLQGASWGIEWTNTNVNEEEQEAIEWISDILLSSFLEL